MLATAGQSLSASELVLQVQALVAEHKLGVQGRKLGIAMTKQLIDTPERLAHVKSASASSWAAINKRKQKSDRAKQSKKQTSPTVSRRHVDASGFAAMQPQATSAEEEQQEAGGAAVSSLLSDQSNVTAMSSVQFAVAEPMEDNAGVSGGLQCKGLKAFMPDLCKCKSCSYLISICLFSQFLLTEVDTALSAQC